MHDRNGKASETIRPHVMPVGVYSIVQIADVKFVTYRAKPSKKRPNPKIKYRHTERMLAWRPRELQEFWSRFVKPAGV